MLHATNLTVALGSRTILRGVSFTARVGQLTAIVGPNGSGKSTLLRALSGELRCTQGTVTLNGADIATTHPARLAAMRAVLPQSTPLAFPFLAGEVVGLGHGAPGLADRALSAVGLHGCGGRFYQELSGGEQQRVQLARVLAQVWGHAGPADAPRWLLLDEPVSSLDIGHQLLVMNLARRFADNGGGVVAVMHDLNLTAMFADQVTLISNGRIAGAGAPRAILTDALLSQAYDCPITVNTAPANATYVLPHLSMPGAMPPSP